MLMILPRKSAHSSADRICMYLASTMVSAWYSSTSRRSSASASALVASVTGTWWKGISCHCARPRKSSWLETMTGTSTGSEPVSAR